MREIITHSEAETVALGENVAVELFSIPCLALNGELGAGKTAVVRGVCRAFHCDDQVTSPTFAILHQYDGDRTVYHFDLYRLNTLSELIDIGAEEVFDSGKVVLIEWSDRAAELLPIPRIEMSGGHGATENERVWKIRTIRDESGAS